MKFQNTVTYTVTQKSEISKYSYIYLKHPISKYSYLKSWLMYREFTTSKFCPKYSYLKWGSMCSTFTTFKFCPKYSYLLQLLQIKVIFYHFCSLLMCLCLTSTEIFQKYSYFTLHEQRKSPKIQLIEKTLYEVELHDLQF